ncbi:MAG: MBL fold metallo-hydrolase, partial [Pseudomonadota bacterium]
DGQHFYERAGFDEAALERYRTMFGGFGQAVSTMPDSYQRLQDGDIVNIGGREWRAIATSGHCPEHISLYCDEDALLISGDQILPTISSNVSVWPTEPNANPLQAWLDACHRLQTEIRPDTLVLPSHGKPFLGAHERLRALIDEHETGLAKLRTLCREPQRVVDTFGALFKGRISEGNLIMATGEAIAHLNYLVARAEMTIEQRDNVSWYQTR